MEAFSLVVRFDKVFQNHPIFYDCAWISKNPNSMIWLNIGVGSNNGLGQPSTDNHQSPVDWVSLVRNLLDDDAEWVTLLRHSLDNHPCERKVSETSFTLGKSLKFIPLGRRRLQFFAITNFIRKPYFPRHLSRNTKFQYLYYTNQNIVFELSIL